MYRRTLVCASVACAAVGVIVAAPAADAHTHRAGSGTVLGTGYHRNEQATISINARGAAFATWEAGGLYAIPRFSSRAATGNWVASQPMYSPSSYVDSAVVQTSGRTVAIYGDDGTEGFTGTYRITGTAGARHWTKEHRIYRDETDAASVSATGYVALWESASDFRVFHILNPDGTERSHAFIAREDPSGGSGLNSIVATDDGGAVIAWNQRVTPDGQVPTCYVTQVRSVRRDGQVGRRAKAGRRCTTYAQSTLTASSSGYGAVLSWPIPKDDTHPRRFGIAVREGLGRWSQHVLPSMGGEARLIAPATSGRQLSVWWTVQDKNGTSIYLQQHRPGQWNDPVLVHRYTAPTKITNLVSALHGARHLVAWTALPDGYQGNHISRLRVSDGGHVRAVALGSGETVLAAAAKGRHLALLTSRRQPGKRSEAIVARLR